MPRAYHPRYSTVHLANDILRLDGITRVTLIPPDRRRPTMLRVYTEARGPVPVWTNFTLPEAREFLAYEKGLDKA